MSEKEGDNSKRVGIRKGKRVACSSPTPLERCVRTHLSDPYNTIAQQDSSVEHYGTQSSLDLGTSSREIYFRGRLTDGYTEHNAPPNNNDNNNQAMDITQCSN